MTHKKAELCPGGVCEYQAPVGAGGSSTQGLVVLIFLAAMIFIGQWLMAHPASAFGNATRTLDDAQKQTEPVGPVSDDARCKVPEFAKAIGHEEKWKLHNNCL